MDNLPHKLKLETSLYIYEKRYSNLKFFNNFPDSISLISWMCPLLLPRFYADKEYIFAEGEDIEDIHFMIKGSASFVLPSMRNTRYIRINKGDHFGIIDIVGSTKNLEIPFEQWYEYKNQLKR